VTEIPPALDDRGRIVDTGEVELWCSDVGDGDALFLVGGLTAGHHVRDFARPYLGNLRTITSEPRGLGRSARPAGAYSHPGDSPHSCLHGTGSEEAKGQPAAWKLRAPRPIHSG
jgi:hypothetical protein